MIQLGLFFAAPLKPRLDTEFWTLVGRQNGLKLSRIETPKGIHVGIHCFRHGVTSELLESGTPIHVVTKLMRHANSNVTLQHYAHIVGDAERVASEKFSQRIGQNITQLESGPEMESVSMKTA